MNTYQYALNMLANRKNSSLDWADNEELSRVEGISGDDFEARMDLHMFLFARRDVIVTKRGTGKGVTMYRKA